MLIDQIFILKNPRLKKYDKIFKQILFWKDYTPLIQLSQNILVIKNSIQKKRLQEPIINFTKLVEFVEEGNDTIVVDTLSDWKIDDLIVIGPIGSNRIIENFI